MAHDTIRNTVLACGFTQAGWLDPATLTLHEEVREICRGNSCRGYGASWACPPAIGDLETCRQRLLRYPRMLLFSKCCQLEDSFDFEGMGAGMREFKELVDKLQEALTPLSKRFLILSNEGCGRCQSCTYPDAPCRFPQLLHHSLEGYGLVVADLAREAGLNYHNGPNTVTFFGALLC